MTLRGEDIESHRLREMGFRENAIIEKTADNGAIICRVGDAKVVLSKKLAENIIVKEVSPLGKDSKTVLLSEMLVGSHGVVESFVAESDDYERIEEMGLTPGEEVEVVRYAPLGDPIEIKIRGYSLSLRKEEADRIRVAVSQ